jgi:NADPH-dependent glutamate synthase beta subunit-like oxidoreductase
VLRRELELIERLGVKFVFNTRVGFDIPLNELDEQFDAVFLSIGTWKESWVYLPGTELKGVIPRCRSWKRWPRRTCALGRKVAVIGGGNAAIDSARTALRMGARSPSLSPRAQRHAGHRRRRRRRPRRKARSFVFLAAPHRIMGDERAT